MDDAVLPSGNDESFAVLLAQSPLPLKEALEMIHAAAMDAAQVKKTDTWTMKLIQKFIDAGDFSSLYTVVRDRAEALNLHLGTGGIRDLLKKNAKNRLDRAILEVAAFGEVKQAESFRRVDKLRSFKVGDAVIDKAWGFGVIKRVDDFYKKITVDFNGHPNHGLSFATACETLSPAPKDHFWTIWHNDPQTILAMVIKRPAELVKMILRSFGNMPVQRLEETLENAKVLDKVQWKKFWEGARRELKSDKCVQIPSRRADPLQIFATAETYGDDYFARLAKNRNPELILDAVSELEENKKMEGMTEEQKAILQERLAFAIKGAQNVNIPLYARCAVTINRLGYKEPPIEEMQERLWNDNACIHAAYKLSVRDTEAMTRLLLLAGESVKRRLLDSLAFKEEDRDPDRPPMSCSMVYNVLDELKSLPACEETCFQLLNQPKAPFALVGWIFRNRKNLVWKKQIPFIRLLDHALALIELTASGESLHIQNYLKQLFESLAWWKDTMPQLVPTERRLLFERIQASVSMESTFQRKIIAYMLELDESLKIFKKAVVQHDKQQVRQTSLHSMAERQFMFKRLVEVEIPKNRKAIQEAKEKGDLSENAEYQYAKDHERELLQRQAELNEEIKRVKETDYSNMPTDKVGPGVTVVLSLQDGSEVAYTILGEWDYDEDLKIISNNTRLAKAVEDGKVGDGVLIPRPDGEMAATIKAILPLSDAVTTWIHSLPEEK